MDEDERAVMWAQGELVAGRYRVGRRLGRGGMGVVDLVHHLGWGVDLAVKSALLHDAHGDRLPDPRAVERFVAEARVWVDLDPHPNICVCHYVQVLRGVPRIFMEYIEGGSVADALRAGRINTLAEMLGVGIQMAWGLAAIHDHNVVHQDVKPGNVLLAADGRVKITDLGLARARAATTSAFGVADAELVTRQGMTPPYASPEQWTGRWVGPATDVWSWAVSILELFTGQVTWSFGPAARDVLAHYLDQQPSVGRAGMPADVAALLGECLADDPGDRPTMDTVADRLVALYETHIGVYPHQAGGAAQRLAGEWNNKALSLLDLGDPVAAQECWKQALRVDPHHPGAMFNHGLARWRSARITDQRLMTDLENLLADLDERRLIRRSADFGETGGNVLHLLALVHLERGDAHSAVELLQEAVEFAADDPVVLAALTTAAASAHRLREPRTLTGHTDWLNSVAVTPDGRRAVTGSSDHTARCWDLTTGRALHTLAGHTATVTSVAVTPDGGRVLTGSRDHDARWWDVATGQVLCTLAGDGPISAVAVTPDGRRAVTGSSDHRARWWDLTIGHAIGTLTGHTDAVTSVAVTPDGRRAVTGSRDHTARWWDLTTGRCLRTLSSNGPILSLAVSPDGRHVLTGGSDQTASWWDLTTGRCLRTLAGDGPILSVAVTADGRHALISDHTARWWDLATGRCLRTFTGHGGSVSSVAVTPDGQHVLTGSWDGTARSWELSEGDEAPWSYSRPRAAEDLVSGAAEFGALLDQARRLLDFGDHVRAAAVLRPARSLPGYTRHAEQLELWHRAGVGGRRTEILACWPVHRLQDHTHSVSSVAVTPDARHALTGSLDRTVRWWDLTTGRCLRILTGHTDDVISVVVAPDGRHALSGSLDRTARWWDLATGRCLHSLADHAGPVTSVALAPDGRHALTGGGSPDHIVRLWDLTTGRCLRTITGHTHSITSVAVTTDGRHALSASIDQTVRWWDLTTGRILRVLSGHTGPVLSVALPADDQHALSGSIDQTVRWWDLTTGEVLHTLTGHTDAVCSVAVTPDGRHALTGSWDGTARWWDLAAGRCLRATGHTAQVSSVAMTSDARYALTGSWDNSAQWWEVDWEYAFPGPDGDEKRLYARPAESTRRPQTTQQDQSPRRS